MLVKTFLFSGLIESNAFCVVSTFLLNVSATFILQVLDHLVIQKLNAEGRLEKKEAKKGSYFDKV